MKRILIIILIIICSKTIAQRTPAPAQGPPIWIENATLHLGNGEVLKNSHLLLDNGKITYIGKDKSKKTLDALLINAEDQHVYPGFIACNTTLGLLEIGAVKASNDTKEVGENNANVRSIIGYNAESKITETTRPNGVLLGQITPQGGRFSGTSSVVQLDAWNWEDAVVKMDEGVHLHWPFFHGDSQDKNYAERKKKYYKSIQEIENYLSQAKNYSSKKNEKRLLRLAALKGIFDGSQTLYVHAEMKKDLLQVLALKEKLEIKKLVIVGGYEAHLAIEELKKAKIPVISRRIHELPMFSDDDIYTSPMNAVKLIQSGILVALDLYGDMSEIAVRNLPFYAGNLVAFGLSEEEALQTITMNPAKILGIDANYGSLEEGKSATLFISEGNALDMMDNALTHAFIDGRSIDLNTFQKELYEKFSEKHGVEIK